MKDALMFPVTRRRNIKRFIHYVETGAFFSASVLLSNVDAEDRGWYLSALHQHYDDALSEARYASTTDLDVVYIDQCTQKLNKIQEILDE